MGFVPIVPKISFRLSIPIAIIILLLGAGTIYLHSRLGPDGRDTLKFGAALLGGITAVYALLLNVQARRAAAANKFVERWNDPKFLDCRKVISQVVASDTVTDAVDIDHFRVGLSFFEELAIGVHRKEADEEILRDFFHTVTLVFYRASRKWIEDRRRLKNQPTAYCEYEKLYTKWEPRAKP